MEIAALAKQLTPREQAQLVSAFTAGLYEIGATFVWSRTMAGLKGRLATLGVDFIAQVLDRPDIRPNAEIHEVLTDYEAVRLAEEFGMIGGTQALRLRHTLEIIAHFANRQSDDDDGMMPEEAVSALRICVQAVLGHDDLDVAVEFADFRRRLETTLLSDESPEVEGLVESAYFFKRTVLRTLLAGCKSSRSAQLETILANLNLLLPLIWETLKDPDRYSVGRAYAELHAEGQRIASSGLRAALLKVAGFDYVPEGLRSSAFLEAAAKVQSAHFGWNNFYNEAEPMKALASLGTSIPGPAFHRCMTATLLVRVGNNYGIALDAQAPAAAVLDSVSSDRWTYFYDQCLPVDDDLLEALSHSGIAARWCETVATLRQSRGAAPTNPAVRSFMTASLDSDSKGVAKYAEAIRQALRRNP